MANRVKRITFDSASASMSFSATQQVTTFSSSSLSLVMLSGPDVLRRILQENGGLLLKEDGFSLLKERP